VGAVATADCNSPSARVNPAAAATGA